MKHATQFILLATIFLVSSFAHSAEPLRHVRIESKNPAVLASEFELQGFDVLEGSVTETHLDLIVSPRTLQSLMADGFNPEVLATGRPFRDIQTERLANLSVPIGYPDLEQILDQLSEVATNFPDICQLVDLTETYGTDPTEERRHLYALKISDNVLLDEDEPAFLMVSNHHAREIVTPVLALFTIDQLVFNYGSDPVITSIVNSNEIWVAPVWNPDGYSYVFDTDNMWRKNRRVFPGGIGVDQNRNYPHGWDSPCSGSLDPSSEIYKGPSPASEAETQTMMAWSLDRQFAKVLDLHSSGREVLHGYACWNHPYDDYLETKAIALSNASGYGGDHRPPTADGEHYQWQIGKMGALAFLMETQTEFQPTYAEALAEAAMVWPGARWLLQQRIPLSGYITNSSTGEPVEATISLPFSAFEHEESLPSNTRFGFYHAFLPDDWYQISVEAEGYATQISASVFANETFPVHLDVAMQALLTGTGPGPNTSQHLSVFANSMTGVLQYEIAHAALVNAEIYDLRGALISTLVREHQAAGQYEISWPQKNNQGLLMPSGIYFYRITADDAVRSGKIAVVK